MAIKFRAFVKRIVASASRRIEDARCNLHSCKERKSNRIISASANCAEKIRATEEIFKSVYKTHRWGKSGDFFSGFGSMPEYVGGYVDYVKEFIKSQGIKSVVDLGCGDFLVGKLICQRGIAYTGVDVVGSLIQRNTKLHSSANIQFVKRDLIHENIPDGELCLIRQVLQHLSNSAILTILAKLKKYRYVLMTDEWVPHVNEKFNIDIPIGECTRP